MVTEISGLQFWHFQFSCSVKRLGGLGLLKKILRYRAYKYGFILGFITIKYYKIMLINTISVLLYTINE